VHRATTSKYLYNSCGWWFKPDFIKSHPEAVRRFVQGLAMARKLINENPAEAIRIYSKYNKLTDDSYKKPFVLAQFDNPPVVYTYGLEQTYKIMKSNGLLKKDIDTAKLVDSRFARSQAAPY
jgi:ABC-type nitrate/sulfonate/bicarbonate transport system substrate-binding protein